MQEIRLIVSDIEGCLSAGKGHPLDLVALSYIQSWNQKAQNGANPPLTLCTGRSQPFVEAFCQALAVFVPAICENGAFLYDPRQDRTIRHPLITTDHSRAAGELLRELESKVAPVLPFRVEPGKDICVSLNPDEEDGPASDARVTELYELAGPLADLSLFNVTYSTSAVDITPAGIDKGAGLRFLSDVTGIPPEAVLGIGDAAGDQSFLTLVGRSAAPANGAEALGSIVGFVANEPGPGGVLQILDHFTPQFAGE